MQIVSFKLSLSSNTVVSSLKSFSNSLIKNPISKMMKLVVVLSVLGVASAGAPLSYATNTYHAGAAYHAPAVAAYHAPAPLAYAAPAFGAYHAPAPLAYAQPIAKAVVRAEPYDAHPQYNYGYSVSDALTGDQKTATESRDGDLVQGQYSLVEPDGSVRTVTYTADSIHGFNAVVDRSPPTVVKTAVHAPVHAVATPVRVAHAPVHYAQAAPFAHAAYSTPLASYHY